MIHIDHPVVRTGVAEQSAELEAGRAVKMADAIARRGTGCKTNRDFRTDPRSRTVTVMPALPGKGVPPLFLRPNIGRRPPPIISPTCWPALGHQNDDNHSQPARAGPADPARPSQTHLWPRFGYSNVGTLTCGDHPGVRAGDSEQCAELERRRTVKRLANVARRETGCMPDRDFRTDFCAHFGCGGRHWDTEM